MLTDFYSIHAFDKVCRGFPRAFSEEESTIVKVWQMEKCKAKEGFNKNR
jgi:hypothetical protein